MRTQQTQPSVSQTRISVYLMTLILFSSSLTLFSQDGKATVENTFKKYFAASHYQVNTIQSVNNGTKKDLSGEVTFFGAPGKIKGTLNTSNEPQKLEVTLSEPVKFNINSLSRIAGRKFHETLPSQFKQSQELKVKGFTFEFLPGAKLKLFHVELSLGTWDFLDYGTFKMKEVTIGLTYEKTSNKVSGNLTGQSTLGSVPVTISGLVSSGKEMVFTASVTGGQTADGVLRSVVGDKELNSFYGLFPSDVFKNIKLPDFNFEANVVEKSFSAKMKTSIGELAVIVKGKNKQLAVEVRPNDITNVLNVDFLKNVSFKSPTVVLLSYRDDDYTSTLNKQVKESKAVKGLNIFSIIDLDKDIRDMFHIQTVELSGSVNSKKEVELKATSKMNVSLGSDDIKFKEFSLGMATTPAPQMNVGGQLSVKVSSTETLLFDAKLKSKLAPVDLGGSLDMVAKSADGVWKNPFGIPNIGIAKVGGEISFSPSSPVAVSALGIRGDLLVGKNLSSDKVIRGDVDILLDINNPVGSMIEGELKNVTLKSFINSFCDVELPGLVGEVLNSGIEHGKVKINPKEAAFELKGDTKMLGRSTSFEVGFSDAQFLVAGSMDPLVIKAGNLTLFSMTGMTGPLSKPHFRLQLNSNPLIKFQAKLNMLETMKLSGDVLIDKNQFKVKATGSLFGGFFQGTGNFVMKDLLTTQPSVFAEIDMNNATMIALKKKLNSFITNQAKNSSNKIQEARKQVNTSVEFINDVGKGFLQAVDDMQSSVATAGILMVDGLIPEIERFYFKGDLKGSSTIIEMEIKMKIAGHRISPIKFNMNMKGGYNEVLDQLAEKIGKELLNHFSYLGDELKNLSHDALNFFEDVGEEIIEFGEDVGDVVSNVADAFNEAWNGTPIPAANFGKQLNNIPTNYRHYMVRIDKVKATGLDDGIELDAVELEMFGGIYITTTSNMRGAKGANTIVWRKNRTDSKLVELYNNRVVTLNTPYKHFYVPDGQQHSIYLKFGLWEFDAGIHSVEDDKLMGGKLINLSSYNFNAGVNQSLVHTYPTSSGTMSVYYTIILQKKITSYDFIRQINNNYQTGIIDLIKRGGDIRSGCLVSQAIKNKNYQMFNFLLANGAKICQGDLNLALSPTYYNQSIATNLIMKNKTLSASYLTKAIQLKKLNIVNLVLAKRVVPTNVHLKEAIKTRDVRIVSTLIHHKAPAIAQDLDGLIQAKQTQLASAIVADKRLKPTVQQLNKAIALRDVAMIKLLMLHVAPDQSSYIAAASTNQFTIFEVLTSSQVPVISSEVTKKAIANKNMAILKRSIVMGAPASTAISQSISASNRAALDICLVLGGNPDLALDYSVKTNDFNLFKILHETYHANPTLALNKSIAANKFEWAKYALQMGADPDAQLSTLAKAKNSAYVKLLVTNGGNPDLAVLGTVENNDVELLKFLIDNGADVTSKTYLQKAATMKSLSLAYQLVENGADPNYGIEIAFNNKDYSLLNYLLENGATTKGYLARAVGVNDIKLVHLFLTHGANPTDGIKTAIDVELYEIAKALLENGADPKGMIKQSSKTKNLKLVKLLLAYGGNPDEGIFTAVKQNDTPMAITLLEYGATEKGLMPTAAAYGNTTIIQVLLDRGVSAQKGVKIAVDKNKTEAALMLLKEKPSFAGLISLSSRNGNDAITLKLLEMGANPEEGMKPAVKNNRVNVVDILAKAGASAKSYEYMDIAVQKVWDKMAEMLFKHGSDVKHLDQNGNSYLHRAASYSNRPHLLKVVLTFGLDINAKNKNGDAPIHLMAMAKKQSTEMAELLLNAGADINALNAKKKTPRKIAKGKVKKYLKEKGGLLKVK